MFVKGAWVERPVISEKRKDEITNYFEKAIKKIINDIPSYQYFFDYLNIKENLNFSEYPFITFNTGYTMISPVGFYDEDIYIDDIQQVIYIEMLNMYYKLDFLKCFLNIYLKEDERC